MLVLAFLAMFASAPGQSFVLAVFVNDMLAGTGLSRTTFSALYAAGTVVSALLSFAVGRVADRRGLRATWIVVAVGLAAGCATASVAGGLVVALLALALLRSFGQGSFPLLGTLIVAHSFSGRRGQAMAIASFGLTAATVALPPLLVLLIDGLGWRSAYRVLGATLLVVVLPFAFLLGARTRETGRPAGSSSPAGVYPPAIRRSHRLGVRVPRLEAGLLLVVLAAPPLVMTALIFHAVSLLADRGLSAPEAAAAVSAFGVASGVATLAVGAIADRLSTRHLLAIMSTLLLAGASVALVPAASASYVAFALIGLAGGSFGVVAGIVWARTYGLSEIGKLQGMSSAVAIAAAAAGPLPLAVSLQLAGSYEPGIGFLALLSLVGLAAALAWREPVRPDRG